ncbi:hypothetical protein CKAN_00145500 [Cinnamomum micranthum f. kanehirae]|uniref:DUF659 domain-containing protein n=1 Tax=Cinnamomum micranthum f. kanehirae TaxID=337451 RepID=A0A3S3PTF1_9MAGN|nr:hypothetical protein CKAN_00145500 [Cinnamomum micranthum f. kanehirae]
MGDMKVRGMKMERVISKFFHHNRIPPNVTNSPYYRSMVDTIAEVGPGVKPQSAYEIGGKYLDMEVSDYWRYLEDHFKTWEEYGSTLMCDGWTNNAANFKATAKKLREKHKSIIWVPYAAHCIYLMLEDIGKLDDVRGTIDEGKMVTSLIYNHQFMTDLQRQMNEGHEILRPGITRSATQSATPTSAAPSARDKGKGVAASSSQSSQRGHNHEPELTCSTSERVARARDRLTSTSSSGLVSKSKDPTFQYMRKSKDKSIHAKTSQSQRLATHEEEEHHKTSSSSKSGSREGAEQGQNKEAYKGSGGGGGGDDNINVYNPLHGGPSEPAGGSRGWGRGEGNERSNEYPQLYQMASNPWITSSDSSYRYGQQYGHSHHDPSSDYGAYGQPQQYGGYGGPSHGYGQQPVWSITGSRSPSDFPKDAVFSKTSNTNVA